GACAVESPVGPGLACGGSLPAGCVSPLGPPGFCAPCWALLGWLVCAGAVVAATSSASAAAHANVFERMKISFIKYGPVAQRLGADPTVLRSRGLSCRASRAISRQVSTCT